MHQATRILAAAAAALTVVTTAHAQATVTVTIAPAQDTAAVAPALGNGTILCGPGTATPSCENVPGPRSRLFDGIELTKAQQDSVDAITLRYRALRTKLNAETMPAAAHNAQFFGLRAREIAAKRKVMTPDQLPRFDANADSLRRRDAQITAEARKIAEERQKAGSGQAKP